MDPNETLAEIRTLVEEELLDGEWSVDSANERCQRYAELVGALDQWLSRKGFLPDAWSRS